MIPRIFKQRLSLFTLILIAIASPVAALASESPTFPNKPAQWKGFQRHDFTIAGKPVLVVRPEKPAEGNPWVWHGEFFGHKPAPDIELLKRGFHIVYLRVPNMLGSPTAVGHWNDCYAELTEKYGLGPKPALVGLSRGGLYCYNWAIANPDKVSCIYGDAPVCDFKSWPGGKGEGKGSPRDWQLVLKEFGFANEAEALAFKGNPVDQLKPLADAKVPLLHVYGDADDVVPWEENTKLIADRYKALGGDITLIGKPGVGHHPHGLEDSTPIVEFIAQHASTKETKSKADDASAPLRLRVLSYNIHHGEGVDGKLDLPRIARVILSTKPDLVALQEVDRVTERTGKVDQAAELSKLTKMEVVFGENLSIMDWGRYGNAVLSRYPIVSHKNQHLPVVDDGEQRGVLSVDVKLPTGQVKLLATHFDYRRANAERLASARVINELVADSDMPMLLAGDLNDTPESDTLKLFGEQWTRANDEIQPTIPVDVPTKQIDFVLYRPASAWRVVETRVLDEAVASDHRAVLAVLELK